MRLMTFVKELMTTLTLILTVGVGILVIGVLGAVLFIYAGA